MEKMNALAEDHGVHLRGPHHEIYLPDLNRVPPASWGDNSALSDGVRRAKSVVGG
jgi:hypothetical protein